MIYEYENKNGDRIEMEYLMSDDIPKEILYKGVKYRRVWSNFMFSVRQRDKNALKMDMDDFSRSKISKGYVKVKSSSGKSYVPAQLRIDKDGHERLVYKSCPTRDTGVKPTQDIVDTLGKDMENFIG